MGKGREDEVGLIFTKPSDCLRAAVRGALLSRFFLTPRQLTLLELLADGLSTSEIANGLHLSERTVEDGIHDLHQALDAHSRAELVGQWVKLTYEALDALGLFLPPHGPDQHGTLLERS